MAKKTTITPSVKNQIQRYKELLNQSGISYDRLILFGSQVKGTAHEYSDIDLCVISKSFGSNSFDERVMLSQLKTDQTIDIEPHPLSPEEFNNKYYTLAAEVKKYGVVV